MDYRIEAETAQEDIRNAMQFLNATGERVGMAVTFDVADIAAIRARLASAIRKLDAPIDQGPSSAPHEERAVAGVPVEA